MTEIFEALGDQRITERCATEECGGQVTHRYEAGGIGSYYCSGCVAKLRERSDVHPGKRRLSALVQGLDGVVDGPWQVTYRVFGSAPDNEQLCAFLRCVEHEELTGVIDETPEGDDPPSPILEHLARCSPTDIRWIALYVEQLEDKVDGLESDLDNAVETAFKRGATDWARLNYPNHPLVRKEQSSE